MTDISCGHCLHPFPSRFWNQEQGAYCLVCGSKVRVVTFPAIERAQTGALPEALGEESEASCFYHPRSRAAVLCAECGRFLCRLCDLEVGGRHVCPACFETGGPGRAPRNLETRRTMYDTIALALATLPALLIWPALVTGPVTLFLIFRWWHKPESIVPRTRVRFYLAALFALAQTGGVVSLIWLIAYRTR
jgi:hypothetical protein